MSFKNTNNQLEDLINQQRRKDSSSEHQSINQEQQLKKFETRLKTREGKRVRNPFSQESSEEEDQPKQLFTKQQSPKKNQNKMEQIQNKIRWKQQKEEKQQLQQLSKLTGEGAKDKKIRELAQKMKSLNLAFQKQKTIRKKLEDQLNSLIKSNQNKIKKEEESLQVTSKKKDEEETFKHKFNQAEKKLMEMRVKNQAMKNQLNKAMRVITRQVGQNINLDQILGEENAWKGRQQKIEKMKSRIKQLEDKLNNNGINVSHMTGFTAQSLQRIQTPQSQQSQITTNTTLAQNRRKQFENLKVQVQGLKSENEILQSKLKSLTSRKLILQSEIKQCKGEFEKKQKLFQEKSENDNKYISLLKQQNEKLKKQEKVVTKLVYKNSNENAVQELNALKKEIERLNSIIQKKDQKIKSLETETRDNLKEIQLDKNNKVLKKRIQQVQKQYVIDSKYEKQLSSAEEQALYKNWKDAKLKISKQ